MGILKEYFIDSSTFALADNIYTDAALTTTAPDGTYSFGGTTRPAVSGVLGLIEVCVGCSVPCDSGVIQAFFRQGRHEISYTTNNDTGIIVAEVTVQNSAVGFSIDQGVGTEVVKMSSERYGKLENPVFNSPTVIGVTGEFNAVNASYNSYDHVSGEFVAASPTTANITTVAGDDLTTAINPGKCVMVLSKTLASPKVFTLIAEAPSANSSFTVDIKCTKKLTQVERSVSAVGHTEACALPISTIAYHVAVNGQNGVSYTDETSEVFGTVGLHDYLYSNFTGGILLTDGYYKVDADEFAAAYTIKVEDGIVTERTVCVVIEE